MFYGHFCAQGRLNRLIGERLFSGQLSTHHLVVGSGGISIYLGINGKQDLHCRLVKMAASVLQQYCHNLLF